ncbi:DUF1697 domain-containing protein [Micrococcus sp. NPDC078436]|uniref:DUF1697 domain-containing protein n=1 Tax=Micrococcus sp. NPDC078436 TaxID=3154960 RepID=UPI00344E2000
MAAPTTLGDVHVLLWRGINVGAHRRIPKVDLIRWAEQAGGTDVRTVQASGNVILTLPAGADPAAVAASVAAAARAERDIDVPVMATSPAELREALAVLEAQGWPEQEPKAVQLTLLDAVPDPSRAVALAALDPGEDRAVLVGRFLWIRHATTVRDSPLTLTRIERTLGVVGTARNLATVRMLAS